MKKISNLKDRLSTILTLKNITPSKLANRTNLARATILNYLKGRNLAKPKNLKLMADFLKVDVLWLEGYDCEMNLTREINFILSPEEKLELNNWINTNTLYFNSMNLSENDKKRIIEIMKESYIRSLKNKDK